MRQKREVIGLTGGIASGKSTVAKLFIAEGVPVIDTDSIARQVSKQSSIQAALIEAFGNLSVQNGELNRAYLTSIIFADDIARQKLNDIMHPAIKQVLLERLARYQEGLIVVDVPLLYETDFHTLMDKVIVVYVDQPVQVERLMQREHLTEDEALLRIKAQMPLAEKVKKADYVLDNTQSESMLSAEFKKLYKELTAVKAERSR